MKIIRITALLGLPFLFYTSFGCGGGGGGLSSADNKLTGQWIAQKLNVKGDRILLTFNASTQTADASKNVSVSAIRLSGSVVNISGGIYDIEGGQIFFDFSEIDDFESPFTVSDEQITLGTEIYLKVKGSLSGPRVGGQIQIGQGASEEDVTVTSIRAASALPEIVPGEILIKYKESSGDQAGLTVESVGGEPKHSGAGIHSKMVISKAAKGNLGTLSVEGKAFDLSSLVFQNLDERDDYVKATLAKIEELKSDPNVVYAVPNSILHSASLSLPSDPIFDSQWNLNLINARDGWSSNTAANTTGQDVIVAVIDTGIVSHEDLVGRVLNKGYDFVEDNLTDSNGGTHDLDLDGASQPGPDSDPTDPGDQNPLMPGGSSWHGTHIAGIIAAAIDNGYGIAGTARNNVKVLPLRAMGWQGNGTLDAVSQAIYYAAKLANVAECDYSLKGNPQPEESVYDVNQGSCAIAADRPKANVINLSLGAELPPDYAQPLNAAIDAAVGQGIVVVAAAGNEKKNSPNFYPAANTNVISVGAVYPSLSFASSYSNYGTTQFLVAPGGSSSLGVVSTASSTVTTPNYATGYAELVGTSQAAAHVSAVAAMVISELKADNPSIGSTDLVSKTKSALQNSATKLCSKSSTDSALTACFSSTSRDPFYGYGLVNACGAVLAAGGTPSTTTALRLSAHSINFGTLGSSLSVLVSGGCGGGQITGISATKKTNSGGDWMGVTLSATTANSTSPALLNFKLNRTGLSKGTYTGTVTVNSTSPAGSATLAVTMQVGAAGTSIGGSELDNLRKDIETLLGGGATGYQNTTDIGEAVILLIDVESGEAKYYTKTDLTANYYFQFGGIVPGNYYVIAGVDKNLDGTICPEGSDEPCLAYPDIANPEAIEVTSTTQKNDLILQY